MASVSSSEGSVDGDLRDLQEVREMPSLSSSQEYALIEAENELSDVRTICSICVAILAVLTLGFGIGALIAAINPPRHPEPEDHYFSRSTNFLIVTAFFGSLFVCNSVVGLCCYRSRRGRVTDLSERYFPLTREQELPPINQEQSETLT